MLVHYKISKFSLVFMAFLIISYCFLASTAFCIPINYQGELLDSNEKPIDGTIDMVFTIYPDKEGENAIWAETHFGVDVQKGYFYVILGLKNDFQAILDQNELYLEITIGDEKLNSRRLITGILFAEKARIADTVKDGAITSAKIADQSITGNDIARYSIQSDQLAAGSVTGEKILNNTITAAKIQDGPGSGLSADLLDGKDSDVFATHDDIQQLSKGSIIELIAGETFNGKSKPVPVYIRKDGLVQEQSSGNGKADIYGVYTIAQIFKTDLSIKQINSISLFFEKSGEPDGQMNLSIQAIHDNDFSQTYDIHTRSIEASSITNGWNLFSFSEPLKVSPDTSYAILLNLPDGNKNQCIKWQYSESDVYSKGNAVFSSNFGQTWIHQSSYDCMFCIYSTSRVYAADATDMNKVNIIGFAVSNAHSGEMVSVQTDGIINGFQNLQSGEFYYLLNNSGTIGITSGSYKKCVGIALNESHLKILEDKDISVLVNYPCQTGMEGQMRYNSNTKVMEYCDGEEWRMLAKRIASSCKEILEFGYGVEDGTYEIDLDGFGGYPPFDVYCDMTTDGGGWTLIALNDQTTTFSNFNKSWNEYKNGFGDLSNKKLGWLGNDRIHALTKNGRTTLQVRNDVRSHTYLSWIVESEANKYKMAFGDSPGADDGGRLFNTHYGMNFSTYDRDNDSSSSSNCASQYQAGWWFKGCYSMTISGNDANHVYWRDSNGNLYYVSWIQMWIR